MRLRRFDNTFLFYPIVDTRFHRMPLKLCNKFQRKIRFKSHRYQSLTRKSIFSDYVRNKLSEKVQICSSGDPPLDQIQEKFSCLFISKIWEKVTLRGPGASHAGFKSRFFFVQT